VFGLVGIVLAILFYLRSRRISQLAYQYDEISLVGGMASAFPEEVEVRFIGTPVPRITVTLVLLWNSGNSTVNGSDVVGSDPVRIVTSNDSRILKHSILKSTRPANGLRLAARVGYPNEVAIAFDFFEPQDGAVIEILHSGPSGSSEVRGSVRGMPAGVRNHGRAGWSLQRGGKRRPSYYFRSLAILLLPILLGGGMLVASLFRPQLASLFPGLFGPGDLTRFQRISWSGVIVGFLYLIFPAGIMWVKRRRYPSSLASECLQPSRGVERTITREPE